MLLAYDREKIFVREIILKGHIGKSLPYFLFKKQLKKSYIDRLEQNPNAMIINHLPYLLDWPKSLFEFFSYHLMKTWRSFMQLNQ